MLSAALLSLPEDREPHDCVKKAETVAKVRSDLQVTTTGIPVMHVHLLKELLKAVLLPHKVAICKCAAHSGNQDQVSQGNSFADEEAKAAAMTQVD